MNIIQLILITVVSCIPDPCLKGLPSSLRFVEPLVEGINPHEVVILSGGDSFNRRQHGFAKWSAHSLLAFAHHHGYGLVFLDQLVYDTNLQVNGTRFTGHWHRVFAMPALRSAFRYAKYFVWIDDDILAPYPETDMLNHYVNMMERDPEWEMLYAEEGGEYVLNSGMFIMKNNDFAFDVYKETIAVGLENRGHLAARFGHEQDALIQVRHLLSLQNKIHVIKHRQGPYNFNTFARDAQHDFPGMKAQDGDAFVHFLGHSPKTRHKKMLELLKKVGAWRAALPHSCHYPVDYALN